jgi:hypothetical protein
MSGIFKTECWLSESRRTCWKTVRSQSGKKNLWKNLILYNELHKILLNKLINLLMKNYSTRKELKIKLILNNHGSNNWIVIRLSVSQHSVTQSQYRNSDSNELSDEKYKC